MKNTPMATVTYKIGNIEIKTQAKYPSQTSIPEAGKKNFAAINAISKIKSETGLDLYKIDEDINQKAVVVFE
ncbi:hypothetical protein [Priestia aryabhattai]